MSNPSPFQGSSYKFVEYGFCPNWIGGEWRPANSGQTIDVINPRHGEVMGSTPKSADGCEIMTAATTRIRFGPTMAMNAQQPFNR